MRSRLPSEDPFENNITHRTSSSAHFTGEMPFAVVMFALPNLLLWVPTASETRRGKTGVKLKTSVAVSMLLIFLLTRI